MERLHVALETAVSSVTGFPSGSGVKNLPANAGATGWVPGQEGPLGKEMSTHASVPA